MRCASSFVATPIFHLLTVKRPTATFSLKVDKDILGKVKVELANDIVPKTVDNFRRLCKGEGIKFKGYSGSTLHYVKKNVAIIGGDIENNDGMYVS